MKVLLRPMVLSDAGTFASWAVDPVFSVHAGWRQSSSVDELVPWWRDVIENPDPLLLRLAAVHGDTLIGYVDLHGDTSGTRELGFVIGPSARWGQGWGTIAAAAGLAYGFEKLGLSSIWAEAVEANVGSLRILERLGMRYTGPGEDEVFLDVSSVYAQFSLSRHDWMKGLRAAGQVSRE